MNEKEIFQKASQVWGLEVQLIKAIEEFGEVIQAIAKKLLNQGTEVEYMEELVDAQIMLDQLFFYLDLPIAVATLRKKKLERVEGWLNESS